MKYTFAGDTNLDETVNVTDLGNLASNYGATSGTTWLKGDGNYNGKIDVTDLVQLRIPTTEKPWAAAAAMRQLRSPRPPTPQRQRCRNPQRWA